MKKLGLFAITLVIFVCCERNEELIMNDQTLIKEIKSHFNSELRVQANARSEEHDIRPSDILWESDSTLQFENGQVVVFDLVYDQPSFIGSGKTGILVNTSSWTNALAYKLEGEIHIEVVKRIPTVFGENFTGYILVESWHGELLRLFEYKEDVFIGERTFEQLEPGEQARIGGLICGLAETIELVGWIGGDVTVTPKYETSTTYLCVGVLDDIRGDGFGGGEEYDQGSTSSSTSSTTSTCSPEYERVNGSCEPTCDFGRKITGECMSEADAWEKANICIKENFEANDCLMKVWNAISTSDAGHELLSGFLKANPEAEICFDFKDIGTDANGNAGYPDADGIINVNINNNAERMGRSQLEFARTILHEMIHAELIRMVTEAGGYNDLQAFAATYEGDDPFMMIWEYYDIYKPYKPDPYNTGWQHEYMADYYIQFIAAGLKELHPLLSSQGFIDYRTGSTVGNSDKPWSWDEFFVALAWQGLGKTTQYQTDVVNNALKGDYDFYAGTARQESATNKCD